MTRSLRCLASLGLVCLLVMAFALVANASATPPDRVVELCGDVPLTSEHLCNVDGGLQEAFLIVEQVTDDPPLATDGRVGGTVRQHQVAVDWYPDAEPGALRPGLAGLYQPSTRRVFLPRSLRDEPLRVRVGVLAHELSHASWDVNGQGQELSPRAACVEDERHAYQIGLKA